MLQYFFEGINSRKVIYNDFIKNTERFNNISHYTLDDDADPDNNFYTTRPLAKSLLVLRKVVDKMYLMIYLLQCINYSFESALKGQVIDNKKFNTLRLVSQHHMGWNKFLSSKYASTSNYPLNVYHQYAEDIELYTDIIHTYCTILDKFLPNVHVLDSANRRQVEDTSLINIALIIHNDCIEILAEMELYYNEQVILRNNIVTIVKQFYRK